MSDYVPYHLAFEPSFAATDDGPNVSNDVMVAKSRRVCAGSSSDKDLGTLGVEVSDSP